MRRENTRTCLHCGSTWRVPRSAPWWRSRLVGRFLAGITVITGAVVEADSSAVARTVESISEKQKRMAEAFRYCPECDADNFTQRTSRGELPYSLPWS